MKDFFYDELNKELGISANLDEEKQDCFYGKLNTLSELQEYKGFTSDTIEIIVDNKYHIIKGNLLVTKFASKEYVDNSIELLKKYTDEQLSTIKINIDDLTLKINDTNERIDNVKIDLSNLDQKLQDEITQRTQDINSLNSLISTETSERKEADNVLSSDIKNLKDNLDGLNQSLSKEISDRESADEVLQSNIDTEIENRKEAITSLSDTLTEKINQEITDRTTADNELQTSITNLSNTKLDASNADRNIINELTVSVNGDNVYLKKDYINLKTLNTSSNQDQLELATNEQAGLMSMSDYQTLYNLKDRVADLEGKTSRLLYTEKTNPTANDINTFVIGLGYTEPFSGVAVVIDKTYHIWHYYENDNIGWQDDGLDTVNTFTNTNAGIIKGAEIDGKVYAETDGTGSLYGWGNLKGRVATNESNITSLQTDLQSEISNRENADNALSERITTNGNNLIIETNERKSADEVLQSQITQNKTDISDEITNRQTADKTLQDNIDTNTKSITTINNTLKTYGNIVTHNVNEFATAEQGTKADSALQPNDNITQLTNDAGYTKVNKSDTNGNIKIDDVETIVYNDTSIKTNIADLQTNKQDKLVSGTNIKTLNNESLLGSGNIDITSAQWGNITGDLSNQTDLQTALDSKYEKPTDGIPKTDLTSDVQESLANVEINTTNITTINSKIPTQASSTNQLADKDFVNSSINNVAAYYITKNAAGDAFESYSELISTTTYYSGGVVRVPTRNDYCIVRTDENNDDATTRYSYQNNQWEFQYIVSDKPLTSDQLKAINSGITSDLVTKLQGIESGAQVNKVTSVNNKTGAVNLTYSDVNALADTTTYLKSASVSNNTLTITKQDDTTIAFQGGTILRRWS